MFCEYAGGAALATEWREKLIKTIILESRGGHRSLSFTPSNFSFPQSFRTLVLHGRYYPVAGRNILRAFEEESTVASRMRHENGFQIKGSTMGKILVRLVAILFTKKKGLTSKRKINSTYSWKLIKNWNLILLFWRHLEFFYLIITIFN